MFAELNYQPSCLHVRLSKLHHVNQRMTDNKLLDIYIGYWEMYIDLEESNICQSSSLRWAKERKYLKGKKASSRMAIIVENLSNLLINLKESNPRKNKVRVFGWLDAQQHRSRLTTHSTHLTRAHVTPCCFANLSETKRCSQWNKKSGGSRRRNLQLQSIDRPFETKRTSINSLRWNVVGLP